MNPEDDAPDLCSRRDYYPTTLWTRIFAARDGHADGEEAWQTLVERYRRPIRGQLDKYLKDKDDVDNLEAEFVGRVFVQRLVPVADRQRGRFRFLLGSALQRFIASRLRTHYTQKHGLRETHIPLDTKELDNLAAAPTEAGDFGPDLDRDLARQIFQRALDKARQHFLPRGTEEEFEWLLGRKDSSEVHDQEIARRLQIKAGTLKTRRHRSQILLREFFREEVADLVAPEEVDDEAKYLSSLL